VPHFEIHLDPIHLMVTDIVMPRWVETGWRHNSPPCDREMKVLYVFGYADNAIVSHGLLGTGLAFLQKPLPPKALAESTRSMHEL